MSDNALLQTMRQLRQTVMELRSTVISDLKPFLNPYANNTFERLPSKGPDDAKDIGVTVTCTCLMTLALTRSMSILYGLEQPEDVEPLLDGVFQKLLAFRWTSSELKENNAFTTALILRAAGMICETKYGSASTWRDKKRIKADKERDGKDITEDHRKYNDQTLAVIAQRLSKEPEKHLRVGGYSASPSIGYWFVDAVDHLEIDLEADSWTKIAQWGASAFRRQISLISANHQVLMDPIELIMATCLCKRLLTKATTDEVFQQPIVPYLPSETELQHGITLFMNKQGDSGIWYKYFPMFHYPGAGSNHCWTFEVLEAILNEFDELVDAEEALGKFAKAVEWCKQYRLAWRGQGWLKATKSHNLPYDGWNSGGEHTTLEAGEPESWATGVVHMFLARLADRLSEGIRRNISRRYGVIHQSQNEKEWKEKTIDTEIKLQGELEPKSLKGIIQSRIIDLVVAEKTARTLPREAKRSVLLFGPPGTGKTRFVNAIAQAIGWSFLPINPSVFLEQGIDGIYAQTNKLFTDLRDLYRTVVFFDEMDAMLQARVDDSGKVQLTVEQQFLTTSMLPHLTGLYDDQKVIFFVATNYGKTFDTAITRPGRFDMLLFVGPPSWKAKRDNIGAIAQIKDKTRSTALAAKLGDWVPEDHLRAEALSLATIGELRPLMTSVCKGKELDIAFDAEIITDEHFRNTVERWEKERFALCVSKTLREQYKQEKDTSEIR